MSTYTYKNARLVLTASYVTAYTVPAATTSVVLSARAANIDTVNTVTVSMQWLDSSAANAATRICDLANITVGPGFEALEKPIVLETGDIWQAKADDVNNVELTLTIVQIT